MSLDILTISLSSQPNQMLRVPYLPSLQPVTPLLLFVIPPEAKSNVATLLTRSNYGTLVRRALSTSGLLSRAATYIADKSQSHPVGYLPPGSP